MAAGGGGDAGRRGSGTGAAPLGDDPGGVSAAPAGPGGEVASNGALAGPIDLGAGINGFRLAAGGTLAGTVSGGGPGTATLDLSAGDITLRPGVLANFARLATEGSGTLTLADGALAHGATSAVAT